MVQVAIGSDGKVLTKFDCATKIGFDNPPAGTLIWVKNKDNNLTAGLQKWDTGKMGGPLI